MIGSKSSAQTSARVGNGLNYGDTTNDQTMPIAIVGTSCRLPGDVNNSNELWNLLAEGRSACLDEDSLRFNMKSFYHPVGEMRGSFVTKHMYFLKQDISHFDNGFFNISPIEAKAIDPQQRLLLELAYEAFENAGISRESLSNSETGVYCALCNRDYDTILSRDAELSPRYTFTGVGAAMASNRISYHFDLKGPSVTVDTACSSSLVAIHQACQAIRAGEITQALVGATNLILDPDRVSIMSSMQFLSPEGRCFSFDDRANGFARAEGVAAIVLKPLDHAIRDGDPIQAVIRASLLNQDGRTSGITMPSQSAQVRMIKRIYSDAGLDPRDTCYIEAHGTGTQAGDATESAAIYESFGIDRALNNPLYIGSVKTNIGHGESAAGLAGLLKSILILQRGLIPPHLNFIKANDKIPLEKWNIKIPQRLLAWPSGHVGRISVNGFGYGGTNGHLILEAVEDYMASASWLESSSAKLLDKDIGGESCPTEQKDNSQLITSNLGAENKRLFVLSHANEDGLSRSASDLVKYVEMKASNFGGINEAEFLNNLAYTLSKRRTRHEIRGAVSAASATELVRSLRDIISESIEPNKRPRHAFENPNICFVFNGQGSQWARMGHELAAYPVFASSLAESEAFLVNIGAEWRLREELNKDANATRISESAISQPCCTALQIALVDLLRSWEILPYVVCGHSSGEIAAAYSAGFLSAHDALNIAFQRGKLVTQFTRLYPDIRGGMLAVGLSRERAQGYIEKHDAKALPGKVLIACINSPGSVTLSGDQSAIQDIQLELEKEGIFNRPLKVNIAYHSHHMNLAKEEYFKSMNNLKPLQRNGNVRMVSSVTGAEIHGGLGAEYWVRNMVSPVEFSDALAISLSIPSTEEACSRKTIDGFLEIGPHSTLAGPITQILKSKGHASLASSYHSVLVRDVDAQKSALDAAGALFATGCALRFDSINLSRDKNRSTVLNDLPTYSWQHATSHWSESRVSSQYRNRHFPKHELLGVQNFDSPSSEPTWKNYICISELPWLKQHAVNDQLIFPASGYICMALEAARQATELDGQAWKKSKYRFRQVLVERALIVPDTTDGIEIHFALRRQIHSAQDLSPTWKEFRVYSLSHKGHATEHCRGLVAIDYVGEDTDFAADREQNITENTMREKFAAAQAECTSSLDPAECYNELRTVGMNYQGPFSKLIEINAKPLSSFCKIEVPDTKACMPGGHQRPHIIHPTTLDVCFQACFAGMMRANLMKGSVVLASIDEIEISVNINPDPGTILLARANVERFGRRKFKANVSVGNLDLVEPSLVEIGGICFTSMSDSAALDRSNLATPCHRVKWFPDHTLTETDDLKRICRAGLPQDSALGLRSAYDLYEKSIIQRVLSTIKPEDEVRMAPHHKKLYNWMQARRPSANIPHEPLLRSQVQAHGLEGEMLTQVNDNIIEILTGKIEPLSVLTQNDLLYRVYSANDSKRCALQLGNYLNLLQAKNPHMTILEIGAGTASTTLPILKALSTIQASKTPMFKKYVFTDISSGFFEKARVKLGGWNDGLLDFKVLDIEKPVAEQGFELGSFDVIIAHNVIHATRFLSSTLANVRDLLKAGGKFCLVEITGPQLTWRIIGGTLPGWWLGEADGRVDSPLLDTVGWNKVLSENSFSGIDLELKDHESAAENHLSLLISTATSPSKTNLSPQIHIVYDDAGLTLAETLLSTFKTEVGEAEIEKNHLGQFDPSGKLCIVLLDLVTPIMSSCSEIEFQEVKNMLLQARRVLWVTRGAAVEASQPEMAITTGLIRTLLAEDHSIDIVSLDLSSVQSSPIDISQEILKLYYSRLQRDQEEIWLPEFEYAVRDGQFLIPRITEDDQTRTFIQDSTSTPAPHDRILRQPYRPLSLEIETCGLLESLHWVDSEAHQNPPGPDEVRIRIDFVALNFRDLMTAMGQLDGLSTMLIEASGIVVETGIHVTDRFTIGDRVCAFALEGLATFSNINCNLAHRIPERMPLEMAAAIPVSYATAFYALNEVARMKKGESILIHSGAGALGQAAIAVARYLEAGEIFVTVGNAEKKSLIMERFGIPDENIFSSHSLSFAAGVRRCTRERGVDVVLNSLTQEAARESHDCLARFGRFIEVGKRDLLSNARMELQYLAKNATYSVVDLTLVAEYMPTQIHSLLAEVISLVEAGKLQILHPITVCPVSELEDAFRTMQRGKHTGKIVLKIDDTSHAMVQPRPPMSPRLRDDRTYLVVGGLGGIGRAVIKLLTKLGAKNIFTLSRSGAVSSAQKQFLVKMEQAGINIVVHKGSVGSLDSILAVKKLAGSQLIAGVIQGAMALEDSTFYNMSHEQWRKSLEPKVMGTLNLKAAFGDSLDFFIILASQAGIVGSHGQANYGSGSTFQDAFARQQSSFKYPVRSLDLGIVGSAGHTAEKSAALAHALRLGGVVIELEKVLASVVYSISHPVPEDPAAAQIILGLKRADPAQQSTDIVPLRPDAKFSHVWNSHSSQEPVKIDDKETNIQSELLKAKTASAAAEAIQVAVVGKLSRLLAMTKEEINPERSVESYGTDSLIAVELRNWIKKQLEADVHLFELMSGWSITELSMEIAKRSTLLPKDFFEE